MNTDARDNFRTHYRAQVHLNRQNHLQPQMNTDTRDNFRTQTYPAQVHLNRQIFDIGVSDARSLATDLRPIQKLGGNSRSVLHELDLAQSMPSVRARLSAPQPDLLDSHRPQHSYSEPSVALPAHKTTPVAQLKGQSVCVDLLQKTGAQRVVHRERRFENLLGQCLLRVDSGSGLLRRCSRFSICVHLWFQRVLLLSGQCVQYAYLAPKHRKRLEAVNSDFKSSGFTIRV